MSDWSPENYTREERLAATLTPSTAQSFISILDPKEFGAENAKVTAQAYLRVERLLESVKAVL